MSEFLNIIFSFPTALFTFPLGLVLIYWLLVILGGIDIEIFDGLAGLEAIDGALDGALDGVLDGGAGTAGGATEGVGSGNAEGQHPGAIASVLHFLGMAGVPLTIPLSFLVIFGWMGSYLGTVVVRRFISEDGWGGGFALLLGSGVAAMALVVSLYGTALAVRPMRPIFRTHLAPKRQTFVGSIGLIRTQRVDADFGQAEISDGGAGLLVEVRCLDENSLTRGSKALVYDYDRKREVYLVAPADESLAERPDAGGQSATSPDYS